MRVRPSKRTRHTNLCANSNEFRKMQPKGDISEPTVGKYGAIRAEIIKKMTPANHAMLLIWPKKRADQLSSVSAK